MLSKSNAGGIEGGSWASVLAGEVVGGGVGGRARLNVGLMVIFKGEMEEMEEVSS